MLSRTRSLALVSGLALALSACSDETPENPTGVTQSEGAAVECPPEEGAVEPVQSFNAAPPMCIDPEKTYTAVLETDAGEVTIALDAAKAHCEREGWAYHVVPAPARKLKLQAYADNFR